MAGERNTQKPAGGREVEFPADGVLLKGILHLPSPAEGVVLFAHGTGSSRLSERNTFVAEELAEAGIAGFLIDLLAEGETEHDPIAGDMPALASRLLAAARWLRDRVETKCRPLGFFGASTGAAVAVIAAAREPQTVRAIVSRGGRTDLARDRLGDVRAPTLLLVGENDTLVRQINEQDEPRFECPMQLSVIGEASHLFEEPGALDEVAERSVEWFRQHFG